MSSKLMQLILFLLLVIVAMPFVACGQTAEPVSQLGPEILWYKTFGGDMDDQGNSVQQTTDDGYIVCGTTRSYGSGGQDIWLIKTDINGNKLWDQTFGGQNNDLGTSVQQTTDGGYIVCGNTASFGSGDLDVWLIKTDANGEKVWDMIFGGEEYDEGNFVEQTTDGGYIVCGRTISFKSAKMSALLIKTDANGNKLWDRTFNGEGLAEAFSVQQTADGDYIVCGNTSCVSSPSGGACDENIWLMKEDVTGIKIWEKTFVDGEGWSVRQTTDSGYIVCGRSGAHELTGIPVWLIKTDADGNKIWDKIFASGRKGLRTWHGDSAQQTSDGGYIVCGPRFRSGSDYVKLPTYIWLIKTDPDDAMLWDIRFPKEGSAWGNSVEQTNDSGYIVCGTTGYYGGGENDVLLLNIAPKPKETVWQP